jgi:hypothetical protein
VVTYDGWINTTTALGDYASGGSPRGAYSTDGIDIWVAGSGTGSLNGVRFTTLGSTESTRLSTTETTLRGVHVFHGQLYVSTGAGTAFRIGAVGDGTPTTAGPTITNLEGLPTEGSPHQFFFADLNAEIPGVDTLYVAWEDAGVTKYSLAAEQWEAKGTIGSSGDNYRGLTGVVNGATVTLYATRKAPSTTSGGGELVSIVDTSGYNGVLSGTATVLATAATNTAFRGVALAPQGLPPIEKVAPEIAASPLTKVYDGQAFEVTATADDGDGGFPADTNQANFTFTFYASPDREAEPIAAPVDAGTYWVDIAYAGNAYYLPVASTWFEFTIAPAELTVSGFASDDKVYDGNTDAVVSSWGTLLGVVGGDDVALDVSGGSASFAEANVGTWLVTAAGLALSGTAAGNYTLSQPNDTSAITAKGLTLDGFASDDKVYDGNTDAAVITLGRRW